MLSSDDSLDELLARGDSSRQAVQSLRGYAYQLIASASAWLELGNSEILQLEVAEDYSKATRESVRGFQIKKETKTLTTNSKAFSDTINSLFLLRTKNPNRSVRVKFLTTALIGREKKIADRVKGEAGLTYWSRVAQGESEPGPLKARLLQLNLSEDAKSFLRAASDQEFQDQLVQAIEWHTGQQDIEGSLKSLKDRVVDIGENRGISPRLCDRLCDSLLARVLEAACNPNSQYRKLTRADFLREFEQHTSVSLPINDMTAMLLSKLGVGVEESSLVAASDQVPLICDQPLPELFATRKEVSESIESALASNRPVWLYGSAGSGKSSVARALALPDWRICRLRDTPADQCAAAVNQVASAISALDSSTLVLDDVNYLHRNDIQSSISSLMHRLSQRRASCIATSYTRPSKNVLQSLGFGKALCVEISNFSESEIGALIIQAGGDARWSKYIQLATGGGHPQLVQAFILNLKDRQWPAEALRNFEGVLSPNADIETVREEARRRLIDELDEDSRELLYRTSLLIGQFDKAMISAISSVEPTIPNVGEPLLKLQGPWIENTEADTYRLTPLISSSGTHIFSEEKSRAVHAAAAQHLTNKSRISVNDADSILLHGLQGREEQSLNRLIIATLSADSQTLKLLDEHTMLGALQTLNPLYPPDAGISARLRMIQVLIVAASSKRDGLSEKWSAMEREIDTLEDQDERQMLRLLVYSKALMMSGIANAVPDFVGCVIRLHEYALAQGIDLTSETVKEVAPEGGIDSVIFCQQLCQIEDRTSLSKVIRQFCALETSARQRLTTALYGPFMTPSLAIKSTWAIEQKKPEFDATTAADDYRELGVLLAGVQEDDLACAAFETAAAIIDESLRDSNRALELIRTALSTVGIRDTLLRAKANILFGQDQYTEYLEIVESLESSRSKGEPVEEIHTWRRIGIARAKLGDWKGASEGFQLSREKADEVEMEDMAAMAIGLLADQAVAKWNSGNLCDVLPLFEQAYDRLIQAPPDAGFRMQAVKRLFGHTVLWLDSQSDPDDRLGSEYSAAMLPGANSNPTPHEEITNRPFPDLVLTLYMLAKIERRIGEASALNDRLQTLSEDEACLSMEAMNVTSAWSTAIANLDVEAICRFAPKVIDVECLLRSSILKIEIDDLASPQRGRVPEALPGEFENQAEKVRFDLAGIIASLALCGRDKDLIRLVDSLANSTRAPIDKASLKAFERRSTLDVLVDSSPLMCSFKLAHLYASTEKPRIDELFIIALRLAQLTEIRKHALPDIVPLREWLVEQWPQLLKSQSFLLRRPPEAIASMDETLAQLAPGITGVWQTLRAICPYLNIDLSPEVVGQINRLAAD